MTRAHPSPAPAGTPVVREALSAMEFAARGCGVFAGHYRTTSLAAVRIRVDEATYFLSLDDNSGAWLATPAALTGDHPEPDPDFTSILSCMDHETSVPTFAWARFLIGEPLVHGATSRW
jgi:hypothetical protein